MNPIHDFYDDYSEGAHPRVLQLLADTNLNQELGYGNDRISARAADLIRAATGQPQAAVHFASGGTQTNLICLASMLKPFESVIAAASGHILGHEAGAIEATGHRAHAVDTPDGKLTPALLAPVLEANTDEHSVRPRAVYVSQLTELGGVYKAAELEALSAACRARGLYVYLDGARLAAALTCASADLSLPDIARLADMFYFGGTKNGALLGEAIVVVNPALQEDFRYHLKQRGALLAKGRVVGAQFAALFEDDLYLDLARHANAMAARLRDGMRALGFRFLFPPESNLVFPVFPDAVVAALRPQFGFHRWNSPSPGETAVRLVTSWATPVEKVDALLAALARLVGSAAR